jgi:hypothetical protein
MCSDTIDRTVWLSTRSRRMAVSYRLVQSDLTGSFVTQWKLKKPSLPTAHAIVMKDTYKSMSLILNAIKYNTLTIMWCLKNFHTFTRIARGVLDVLLFPLCMGQFNN